MRTERREFDSNRRTKRISKLRDTSSTPSVITPTTRRVNPFGNHREGSHFSYQENNNTILDPPKISVWKEKNHFEVRASVKTEAHPDTAFLLITDYKNSPKIFKAVASADVEKKEDHYVVTQHARWRFLFLSGTYDVKMKCYEDRPNRTLHFQLAEPGFMHTMQGFWKIGAMATPTGSIASHVTMSQQVKPAIVPPGILSKYAINIMKNQMKAVLSDLCFESSLEQFRIDNRTNDGGSVEEPTSPVRLMKKTFDTPSPL